MMPMVLKCFPEDTELMICKHRLAMGLINDEYTWPAPGEVETYQPAVPNRPGIDLSLTHRYHRNISHALKSFTHTFFSQKKKTFS